ncbi:MAG: PhzF family phenazine biosynthesis isomerase [Gammaproteobacteria bacterium]|nr:PhzF family phenazine biosynthesis isomerase [Gammaproteobacteria bacterium]
MSYTFYTADVFTEKPFNGAQVPVFPDASGLSTEQMQRISNETGAANTVFVEKLSEGRFKLRSFTPFKEVAAATHAVLAAAQVLASTGACVLGDTPTELDFECQDSGIKAHVSRDGGKPGIIEQSMVTHATIDRFTPSDDELAAMLSLTQPDIGFDHFRPLILSCGTPYLVVPIKSYRAIQEVRFKFDEWSRSSAPSSLAQNLLLFSNNTDPTVADFHVRLFGPDIGGHEDPPVGATIPAFANYLCAHSHIQLGTHVFAVERGHSESRQSIINVEMDNRRTQDLTIRVGGRAVLMSESKLMVA